MKNILFIAPFDTKDRFKGGITSFAETIIKNNDKFINEGIYFTSFNNCIVNRKAGTNGKFSILNFLNFFKTRKQLSKEIKSKTYDAIYLNTSFGISLLKDLFALKKRDIKNCKVFLHIHFANFDSIFTTNAFVRKRIFKQIKSKVSTIVSLSTLLKKDLINAGFNKESIDVLYNYFNPDLPSLSSNDIIQKGENDIKTFLFVGSLDERKGFYDLVHVFENFKTNNVKLIICGKPNDSKSQNILNQISKNPTFDYRGYVNGSDKNKAFLDSDVFILPSYGEGLPITILEAFRFGLPVISTNVGSIPEILNEQLGTIIHPGNLVELSNAIDEYSNNSFIHKKLNCLKESEKYTFDTFAKNLVEIIRKKL